MECSQKPERGQFSPVTIHFRPVCASIPSIESQLLHVPAFPVLHFPHSVSESGSCQFPFPRFVSSPACCFLPYLLTFTCHLSLFHPPAHLCLIPELSLGSFVLVAWFFAGLSVGFPDIYVSTCLDFACFLNSALICSPLIVCL